MVDVEKQGLLGLAVISSTKETISPGATDIPILLSSAAQEQTTTRIIFEANNIGTCFLFVTPTNLSGARTLTSAVSTLKRWLSNPDSQSFECTYKLSGKTYQAAGVSLNSTHPTVSSSFSSERPRWALESRTLSERWATMTSKWQQEADASPESRIKRNFAYSILSVLLAVSAFFLSWQLLFSGESAESVFIQYDVGSSQGPRYTSLLPPENVTEWVANHYDPAAYYWRLDEQALVPIEFLDEQEERYQEYLTVRYPEKAEMARSRAWQDPEFLAEPNNFMLPTDMPFHRGHCVRVFRRYWQAKETGKHAAPWDLSYLHLHHCFSMLEDLIYVPGPREQRPDQVLGMSWRTKVVAWEPIDKIKI